MKNIKRIIAFALTFALMTTVLCFTAFAANTPEQEARFAEARAAVDAVCFTSGSRGSAESTGIIGAAGFTEGTGSVFSPEEISDDVTWKLKDGVLILDGNGYMAMGGPSFNRYLEPFAKNEHIKTIIVGPNVKTNFGIFNTLPNLETLILLNNDSWHSAAVINSHNIKTVITGADMTDTPIDLSEGGTVDEYLEGIVTIKRMSGNRVGTTYVGAETSIAITSQVGNINDLAAQAKAALANAHMTDEAWAMLPKALGGTESYVYDPINQHRLTVSNWAKESVYSAFAADIMPVPSVLPKDYTKPITRGEFCELAVLLYEHITGEDNPWGAALKDVPYDHPHQNALTRAYHYKIITGYGTTKDGAVIVGPDDLLTREQAAVILNNMATALGKPMTAGNPPYTDSPADWAKTAVLNCYGSGIMLGTSTTTFSPKANYTIEQSVVTMLRLTEYVTK